MMCAGLTKYRIDWCHLYPLVRICSIAPRGPKYVTSTAQRPFMSYEWRFQCSLYILPTSHNRLHHQIETSESCARLYTTPLSTTHSLAGWQCTGKVVFPFAALLWKIRRQNKTNYTGTNAETSRSRGSMPTTARGDAERGERERLNAERWRIGDVRIIQQQSVSQERESREEWSGESQINLSFCTFLLSPASLPSPTQSTMEEVSRLACSPIRKGITFTHFLRLRKLKLDENVSGSKNFLTNPWVIEVPGKEAFLCPCQIYLARSQICSWGTSKQPDPDNKYDPRKLWDVFVVPFPSMQWPSFS